MLHFHIKKFSIINVILSRPEMNRNQTVVFDTLWPEFDQLSKRRV